MDKQVSRAWSLDKVSAAKVAQAQENGQIIKEYISTAVDKALAKGLKQEPQQRLCGAVKFIKMDEGLFFKMSMTAVKNGLSANEYVRRAIRQHG